jgi:hypothetical protein
MRCQWLDDDSGGSGGDNASHEPRSLPQIGASDQPDRTQVSPTQPKFLQQPPRAALEAEHAEQQQRASRVKTGGLPSMPQIPPGKELVGNEASQRAGRY